MRTTPLVLLALAHASFAAEIGVNSQIPGAATKPLAAATSLTGSVALVEGRLVVRHQDGSEGALASGSYLGGNAQQQQGWNTLEVTGNAAAVQTVDDWLQVRRAMGFLEGELTCKDILQFYPNFYSDLFGTKPPGAGSVAFIKANYAWTKSMAEKKAASDEYWLAQLGTIRQLEGLYEGFLQSSCLASSGADKSSWAWDSVAVNPILEQFLLINAWGDMYQIALKFEEPTRDLSRLYGLKHDLHVDRCSALVKVLPDYSDVLFAHNTWDGYEGMGPRILKHYAFPMFAAGAASSPPSSFAVSYDTFFSSSPMLLSSVDDFFIVNGRANLGVLETTNSLANLKLLELIKPETVLSWLRSTASNVLATSGAQWPDLFARYHSGTYTNQWMVLDLSLFNPGSAPPTGFFSVLEEVPGLVVSKDQTALLLEQTYWRSFNSPFYPDIQEAAGYTRLCKAGVSNACYEKAPRAVLFAEYQGAVSDLTGMQAIMQYNNFTQDAASAGDSCQAIACRGDLEPDERNVGAFGALDAKVGSAVRAKAAAAGSAAAFRPSVFAHLGPATSGGALPAFCWSKFAGSAGLSHVGQPDCFDFDWFVFGAPV